MIFSKKKFIKIILFTLQLYKSNWKKYSLNMSILFFTLISMKTLIGYRYAYEKTMYTLTKFNNNIGDFSIFKINNSKKIIGENLFVNQFSKITNFDLDLILKNDFIKNQEYEYFLQNSTFAIVSNGIKSIPQLLIGVDPKFKKFYESSSEVNQWIPNYKYTGFSNLDGFRLTDVNLKKFSISNNQNLSNDQRIFSAFGKTRDGYVNAINLTLEGNYSSGNSILDLRDAKTTTQVIESLTEDKSYSSISFFSNKKKPTNEDLEKINLKFKNSQSPYVVIANTSKEINPTYFGSLSFVDSLVITFIEFILLTGLIGFISISYMIALNRKKDIGIFQTLGFKLSDIRFMMLFENILVSIPVLIASLLSYQIISLSLNKSEILYQTLGFGGGIYLKLELPFTYQITIGLVLALFFILIQFFINNKLLDESIISKISDKEA